MLLDGSTPTVVKYQAPVSMRLQRLSFMSGLPLHACFGVMLTGRHAKILKSTSTFHIKGSSGFTGE